MTEPLIILRNRDRFRLFQCSLYHSIVCVQGGKCICIPRERTEAHRQGEIVLAEQSVVIAPRQESQPLPRIVLEVPQVQTALKERWLEVLEALAPVEVVNQKMKRR